MHPEQWELALRLLVAAVLGGLIGLEREITDQNAGLRTHISVALGAALFGIASAFSFSDFDVPRDRTVFQVDVTRIASNIVTGVGFLGGGAIIKHGASVRGLTTAGSMWVTAAVGLACALGSYVVAVATTAILLLSLVGLRGPRRWIRTHLGADKQQLRVHLRGRRDVADVMSAIQSMEGVEVHTFSMHDGEEGAFVRADLRWEPGADSERQLARLAEHEGVTDVDVDD